MAEKNYENKKPDVKNIIKHMGVPTEGELYGKPKEGSQRWIEEEDLTKYKGHITK